MGPKWWADRVGELWRWAHLPPVEEEEEEEVVVASRPTLSRDLTVDQEGEEEVVVVSVAGVVVIGSTEVVLEEVAEEEVVEEGIGMALDPEAVVVMVVVVEMVEEGSTTVDSIACRGVARSVRAQVVVVDRGVHYG